MPAERMLSPLSRFLAVTAVALALGCGGCEQLTAVTDAERIESFEPFESAAIGSESLRNHLLRRSALVIAGADVTDARSSEDASASLNIKQHHDLIFGTATAVDRRGYFVTAAHCIRTPGISLVIPTRRGIVITRARVVWKGSHRSTVSDFAVLHVPQKLDYTFEWAKSFEAGDPVVSAGVSGTGGSESHMENFQIDPVGGRIVKVVTKEANDLDFEIIRHDTPLRKGNSGGPLVTEQGRLLAVNHGGITALLNESRPWLALASRPDLDWLKKLIEQDAQSQKAAE